MAIGCGYEKDCCAHRLAVWLIYILSYTRRLSPVEVLDWVPRYNIQLVNVSLYDTVGAAAAKATIHAKNDNGRVENSIVRSASVRGFKKGGRCVRRTQDSYV